MFRHWLHLLPLLAAGSIVVSCGGSTDNGGSSGGANSGGASSGGASSGGTSSGGTSSGGASSGGVGATGGGGSAPVFCGGVTCAVGEDCCVADGTCFDPVAAPGACAPPSGGPNPQGQAPCTASSQCGPDEYCLPDKLCLGPGHCASKSNCPTSSGASFCGCDGVTYPDAQTACHAGATVIGMGKCGEPQTVGAGGGSAGKSVIYCASNATCPAGQECCNITGQCYDSTQPALCDFPPPGTNLPCLDDTQCFDGFEYCKKDGCDGPGGCVAAPGTGSCTGELTPVCGCNGKSYTNAACAAVDGTNVAHAGQCTP
ncbi:MAG: hypothetical protein KC776_24240 [Myxococcales bacterium]|nr:hypothetical protein [Myxococcales bacterium]